MTTEEAKKALTREFMRGTREGGGWPVECDEGLNNASREVVTAMAEDLGEVWLGCVNLYDHARVKNGGGRDADIMWKWDGSLVRNFSCTFVAPAFDVELVALIRARDVGPYTTAADDAAKIETIHERLRTIGGVHLFWT